MIWDCAKITQPLIDLTRHLAIPVPKHPGWPKRGAFRHVLEGTLITYKFSGEEHKAFMELMCILTTEPVLKSPVYDGRVFVISTNGAKLEFGAVLA